jgi:hypothetical protein
MDYNALATVAIGTITPYLMDGGKELTKLAVKELWEIIKSPFTTDREKHVLEELEQKPKDPKTQGKAELILSEKLESSPDLAQKIQTLIDKLQKESGQNTQIGSISQSKNVVINSILDNSRVGDNIGNG